MFKKGEYIVTLATLPSYRYYCAKVNFCFKQKRDYHGIAPELDLSGATNNCNSELDWNKTKALRDWRYATPEEAAEYERLGKPYDVTALKKSTNCPLVPGLVYFASDTKGWWAIARHLEDNGNSEGDLLRADYSAMIMSNDSFRNKRGSWCYSSNTRTYRLATPSEIVWLEACEKAGTLVPRSEIVPSPKLPKESLVGRYLRCVKDGAACITCSKGDYLRIITQVGEYNGRCIHLNSGKEWSWSHPHHDLELMPLGFLPITPKLHTAGPSQPVDSVSYLEHQQPIIIRSDTRNTRILVL